MTRYGSAYQMMRTDDLTFQREIRGQGWAEVHTRRSSRSLEKLSATSRVLNLSREILWVLDQLHRVKKLDLLMWLFDSSLFSIHSY